MSGCNEQSTEEVEQSTEEVDTGNITVVNDSCTKPTNSTPGSQAMSFKVPLTKVKAPIKEFSDEKSEGQKAPQNIIMETLKETEGMKDKSKLAHLSPAELLKQSEIPIPYKKPSWGGLCQDPYFFEVLKNGAIISKVDLTTKSYHVFGRLPSCDVAMDHPSLSRHHAVVQFCNEKTERHDIGWYLYDLDSTHGTWLNKNKLQPRIYYRLRVGYVVKFGGSTRLHILQGPTEDQEMESELSVSEIKEQRERQKKEIEVLRLAELTEIEEKKKVIEKIAEDSGCSWGIGDDATEIDSNNPFALDQPQNEELYIDDPKKSLKGYFEREGHDLPEYDIEDMSRGKYCCRVELPVYDGNGEPIIAEATVTGKKKEAVAACALEACRILDKMGELRKANHESRKRKAKNWEENDFYDSDEDTFLDRTGDIERKRQFRMKKFGKEKEDGAQTYQDIVLKLEANEKEMKEIQEKLDEAKAKAAAVEAEEGLDALDLFMANIKSGSMDTKTRMSLKRRLFEIKQEQTKLQKLANIAKPANVPMPSKPIVKSSKPLPAFGKIKVSSLKTKPQIKPQTETNIPVSDKEFEVEEDEEDDVVEEQIKKDTDTINNEKGTSKKDIGDNSDKIVKKETLKEKEKCNIESDCKSKSDNVKSTPNDGNKSVKTRSNADDISVKQSEIKASKQHKAKVKGATLSTEEFIKHAKKRKKEDPKSENLDFDPDYAAWIPPEGQSGDGRTSLNDKYGY